ncbi:WD40 repeat domain-containing protein [Chromobacterium sp. ATCC 53434]|uniref:WD40 repeat domain-containing protein n=1 Tax=Chromobacterium sp. (strain ATCC 53434 / SC 14030) TaxID=2059672 RepID=UPI0013053223|nr:hypothetical protein [Chromobacterium sp. ATCC 53434]
MIKPGMKSSLSFLLIVITSFTLRSIAMAESAGGVPAGEIPHFDNVKDVSVPRPKRIIDLRNSEMKSPQIRKISFSPDGRYLGIAVSTDRIRTDILVWDLKSNGLQSRIHCPFDYGDMPDHDLLWSADGKVISFGAKKQWDPLSGDALPDNPAIGRGARLNKDGSKMLTIVGIIGEPSYIHVYDTKTWALHRIYVDGLAVVMAAWTTDDKIVSSATGTRETYGKAIDGHIVQFKDAAIRLLDPLGKEKTKTVWFSAEPTGNPISPLTYGFAVGAAGKTNFVTNQIFLNTGRVIDGATLSVRRYHSFDEGNATPGAFGMGFSRSGKFLYLKGSSFPSGSGRVLINNSIVDVVSGKPLVQFGGGLDHMGDLAVSPNGDILALGDGYSVILFDI